MSMMPIDEMISEWRTGCTCAGPRGVPPTETAADCAECTAALVEAIQKRHGEDVTRYTFATVELYLAHRREAYWKATCLASWLVGLVLWWALW